MSHSEGHFCIVLARILLSGEKFGYGVLKVCSNKLNKFSEFALVERFLHFWQGNRQNITSRKFSKKLEIVDSLPSSKKLMRRVISKYLSYIFDNTVFQTKVPQCLKNYRRDILSFTAEIFGCAAVCCGKRPEYFGTL